MIHKWKCNVDGESYNISVDGEFGSYSQIQLKIHRDGENVFQSNKVFNIDEFKIFIDSGDIFARYIGSHIMTQVLNGKSLQEIILSVEFKIDEYLISLGLTPEQCDSHPSYLITFENGKQFIGVKYTETDENTKRVEFSVYDISGKLDGTVMCDNERVTWSDAKMMGSIAGRIIIDLLIRVNGNLTTLCAMERMVNYARVRNTAYIEE